MAGLARWFLFHRCSLSLWKKHRAECVSLFYEHRRHHATEQLLSSIRIHFLLVLFQFVDTGPMCLLRTRRGRKQTKRKVALDSRRGKSVKKQRQVVSNKREYLYNDKRKRRKEIGKENRTTVRRLCTHPTKTRKAAFITKRQEQYKQSSYAAGRATSTNIILQPCILEDADTTRWGGVDDAGEYQVRSHRQAALGPSSAGPFGAPHRAVS